MAITEHHEPEHDAEVIDLDEFLAGPEPDFDTEPTAPVDMDQAERFLRHWRRLQADADRATEVANTQRARIDLWLSAELDRVGRQQRWFEQSLFGLHSAILRATPKAKTLHLPSGSLRARAQQPEWAYDDEEAFVAWAVEHRPELAPDPVPPPLPARKPAKAEAKKRLTLADPKARPGMSVGVIDPDSGEVVPGLHVVIRGDTHWIELPGEEAQADD